MLGLGNSLTGGVVIEEAWTPADLPNLLHWYKYGTGISTFTQSATSSNVLVTQWSDQKGTNHLLDQSTPSDNASDGTGAAYNQSTPKTDGSSIVWDHSADALLFTTSVALGKFAIYTRISATNTTWNDVIMEGDSNNFLKIHTGTEIRFKFPTSGRQDFTPPVTLGSGTNYNVGWERNVGGDLFVFVDNAASSLKSGGSGTGNSAITNLLTVTQVGDPLSAQTTHELIICNDSLSSDDRANLQTYLAAI